MQGFSFPLSELRFGDFNGDRITDVLSTAGNVWSVSWEARSPWQKRNDKLSDDLGALLIGNVDGLPGDDIVRYVAESPVKGRWEMSSGGRGPWQMLGSLSYANDDVLALEYRRYSSSLQLGTRQLCAMGFLRPLTTRARYGPFTRQRLQRRSFLSRGAAGCGPANGRSVR